jgi:hypothetical protein
MMSVFDNLMTDIIRRVPAYRCWLQGADYRYFDLQKCNVAAASLRTEVKQQLEGGKRLAYKVLKQIGRDDSMRDRLSEINNYVFRIYHDMLLIQSRLYKDHGKYFQGKPTVPNPPSYKRDGYVFERSGLSDQIENWRDIGYLDECAPVQLRCDVYDGPSGAGFIVTARFRIDDQMWESVLHEGSEDRNIENYVWKASN